MANLGAPMVDATTGLVTRAWGEYFVSIFLRTGQVQGVDAAAVQGQVGELQSSVAAATVLQLGDVDIGAARAGVQLSLELDLPPMGPPVAWPPLELPEPPRGLSPYDFIGSLDLGA